MGYLIVSSLISSLTLQGGFTALHLAAHEGYSEVVKILSESNIPTDINIKEVVSNNSYTLTYTS